MKSLNSLASRFLDTCAKHTKRVHIIVYLSVWLFAFSFLRLISGGTAYGNALALTLGLMVNSVIGVVFWGIPLGIIRWREKRGKEARNLIGIVNVFLLQFIALPCFSFGLFTLFAGILIHDANPPTAFGGKGVLLTPRGNNELVSESLSYE